MSASRVAMGVADAARPADRVEFSRTPDYNIDWVYSNTSNVHIATHRSWFTDFTSFNSHLESWSGKTASGNEILGIGTVKLEVRRSSPSGSANARIRKGSNTIVLKQVLYVPKFGVNLIGSSIHHGHIVTLAGSQGVSKIADEQTGETVGLLDRVGHIWKLWLKFQPQGVSGLPRDQRVSLHASWSDQERSRWKEHKRALNAAYQTDWVISNTSNVHVANSRLLFETYHHFPSRVGYIVDDSMTPVEGIGDVLLEVRCSRENPNAIKRLLLGDVLHAPTFVCNVFGMPVSSKYILDFGHNGGLRLAATDKILALQRSTQAIVLPRLWLKGQSEDGTSLDTSGNRAYYINATWPDDERSRWEAHQQASTTLTPESVSAKGDVPPYTAEEKKWLKDHYGGEFHFLQSYGLKIHDEEDREEGRCIMRAFAEAEDEAEDEEDEEDDFLRDLEEDPASHLGDYAFSPLQLDWIEKHYRHSGNFLVSYGLKAWEDEDCRQGALIVEAMMSHED